MCHNAPKKTLQTVPRIKSFLARFSKQNKIKSDILLQQVGKFRSRSFFRQSSLITPQILVQKEARNVSFYTLYRNCVTGHKWFALMYFTFLCCNRLIHACKYLSAHLSLFACLFNDGNGMFLSFRNTRHTSWLTMNTSVLLPVEKEYWKSINNDSTHKGLKQASSTKLSHRSY